VVAGDDDCRFLKVIFEICLNKHAATAYFSVTRRFSKIFIIMHRQRQHGVVVGYTIADNGEYRLLNVNFRYLRDKITLYVK